MNKTNDLGVGDVVQLNPETVKNKAFGGCFMTVTEPKAFGAVGYVQPLGEGRDAIPRGQAFYRANWDEFEFVGQAAFLLVAPDGGPRA